MRLESCYIENFGTLHAFSYQFEDGLNMLLHPNGWGKTTFAAFLKAMFYGLPYTTKRSLTENERKKYMPWAGGAYGGNVVFSDGNQSYRIERFFGEKDKEDTFALYNQNTGLLSDAYSENIGEELFGIDLSGYERSTFIGQKQLQVVGNDSIQAKLANRLEEESDVAHYEAAVKRLEDQIRYYKKTGNRGRIAELSTQFHETSRKLEQTAKSEKTLFEIERRLKNRNDMLNGLYQELKTIKANSLEAGRQEAKAAKREHYASLCEECKQSGEEVNLLEQFFRGRFPEQSELESVKKSCMNARDLSVVLEGKKAELKELEKRLPEVEETTAEAKSKPAAKIFTWVAIIALWILAGVLTVAGVMQSMVICFIIALVCAAEGAVLLIILLSRNTKKRKNAMAVELKKQELLDSCQELKKICDDLNLECEKERAVVDEFLSAYDVDLTNAYPVLLDMEQKLKLYQDAVARHNQRKEKQLTFERENDMVELQKEERPLPPLADLQRQEERATKAIRDNELEISTLLRNADEIRSMSEEASEWESERDRLQDALSEAEEQCDIFEQTAKYLKQANENFSNRYFDCITEKFDHYLDLLGVQTEGPASIDLKFDVKTDVAGKKRDLNYYSEGYKTLLMICARMALVDALFEQETPFLILDDPFVDLDEEKIEYAQQMIKKLELRYQIIYFVCHDSRSIS